MHACKFVHPAADIDAIGERHLLRDIHINVIVVDIVSQGYGIVLDLTGYNAPGKFWFLDTESITLSLSIY